MEGVFGVVGAGAVVGFVASAVMRGLVVSVVVSVLVKGEARKQRADERAVGRIYSRGRSTCSQVLALFQEEVWLFSCQPHCADYVLYNSPRPMRRGAGQR